MASHTKIGPFIILHKKPAIRLAMQECECILVASVYKTNGRAGS